MDVPVQEINAAMFRLARGNLLEYKPLGNWFGKIDDSTLAQEIYPRRSAGASPEKSPVC